MKSWIKILSVALILIIGGYGSIVAYQHFKREAEIKAKLEEAVGKDAGYTETILKIEEDSAHISYGELFALCDKSIDQRTNLIVELRGLYPSVNHRLKEELIQFLSAENDLVRTKRELYRNKMKLSTAIELTIDAVKDTPHSEYGWDYHRDRVKKTKEEMQNSARDLDESAMAFRTSYEKTIKLEGSVSAAAAKYSVRFAETFKQFEKSNVGNADEARSMAQKVLSQT